MLTEEEILKNKKEFIELISSIYRPGFKLMDLLDYLEGSDFYTAPASTTYHHSYKGGLCEHSLNVYKNLLALVKSYNITCIDDNTLKIVALFHDCSKINYYQLGPKRVFKDGSWSTIDAYSVIPPSERKFVFLNHELDSVKRLTQFIDLTDAEEQAICLHHGGREFSQNDGTVTVPSKDLEEILKRNPLVNLLHTADYMSAKLDN